MRACVSLKHAARNDAGVRLAGSRNERRAERNRGAQNREPESCSHGPSGGDVGAIVRASQRASQEMWLPPALRAFNSVVKERCGFSSRKPSPEKFSIRTDRDRLF